MSHGLWGLHEERCISWLDFGLVNASTYAGSSTWPDVLSFRWCSLVSCFVNSQATPHFESPSRFRLRVWIPSTELSVGAFIERIYGLIIEWGPARFIQIQEALTCCLEIFNASWLSHCKTYTMVSINVMLNYHWPMSRTSSLIENVLQAEHIFLRESIPEWFGLILHSSIQDEICFALRCKSIQCLFCADLFFRRMEIRGLLPKPSGWSVFCGAKSLPRWGSVNNLEMNDGNAASFVRLYNLFSMRGGLLGQSWAYRCTTRDRVRVYPKEKIPIFHILGMWLSVPAQAPR